MAKATTLLVLLAIALAMGPALAQARSLLQDLSGYVSDFDQEVQNSLATTEAQEAQQASRTSVGSVDDGDRRRLQGYKYAFSTGGDASSSADPIRGRSLLDGDQDNQETIEWLETTEAAEAQQASRTSVGSGDVVDRRRLQGYQYAFSNIGEHASSNADDLG